MRRANEPGRGGLGYNVIFGDDLRKPAFVVRRLVLVACHEIDPIFYEHKIPVYPHLEDQLRPSTFEVLRCRHNMLYVMSSRRVHSDGLGSCICLHTDQQSLVRKEESHPAIEMDAEQSSDQSGEETFDYLHIQRVSCPREVG